METKTLNITEADIQTLRAYRDFHRKTGQPMDISSVFNLVAILAPDRLSEVVEEQDWQTMDDIVDPGFRYGGLYHMKPANMRLIHHHNPEAVDRWLAKDASSWRSRLPSTLDIKEIEEDSDWEGHRGRAFRHNLFLCMLTHADWLAERLPVDEVRSMISNADWDKVRSAFAFCLGHHRIDWNVLHRLGSFSAFFPTEAKELLDRSHGKVEQHLGGWRTSFVRDVSTESLNFGRTYLHDLGYLHRVDPEYARKVVREEDWQLLCQQRERLTREVSSRVSESTVFHLTACLEDLAALQPLFVS